MKKLNVLVLEDDLETLSVIFNIFIQLNERADFMPVVLSKYSHVEKLINNSDLKFDLILLDRDCAEGGSFHILDIERFGPDKVISISSCPPYNEDARNRGITKVVEKDYMDLKKFENELCAEVEKFISSI